MNYYWACDHNLFLAVIRHKCTLLCTFWYAIIYIIASPRYLRFFLIFQTPRGGCRLEIEPKSTVSRHDQISDPMDTIRTAPDVRVCSLVCLFHHFACPITLIFDFGTAEAHPNIWNRDYRIPPNVCEDQSDLFDGSQPKIDRAGALSHAQRSGGERQPGKRLGGACVDTRGRSPKCQCLSNDISCHLWRRDVDISRTVSRQRQVIYQFPTRAWDVVLLLVKSNYSRWGNTLPPPSPSWACSSPSGVLLYCRRDYRVGITLDNNNSLH
jgi:hypothetical protein